MINRKRSIVCVVLALMLMMGCATGSVNTPSSASQDAYKALQTAAVTYDATMKIVADLYAKGTIGTDVKARAITYGRTFQAAYNVAVDVCKSGGTPDITTVTKALADLVALVKPYTGGK